MIFCIWRYFLFYPKSFYFTCMCFVFLIVIDPNKNKPPSIMLKRLTISFFPDLGQRGFRAFVVFEFHDQCGIIPTDRNVYHVGKALSRCHFPDHGIIIQRKNIRQINRALQHIFIIVAAVRRYMNVGFVQCLRNGLYIPVSTSTRSPEIIFTTSSCVPSKFRPIWSAMTL